jgi:hypothetical protein
VGEPGPAEKLQVCRCVRVPVAALEVLKRDVAAAVSAPNGVLGCILGTIGIFAGFEGFSDDLNIRYFV